MTASVKICGLKTPEAIAAAIEGGAEFIGFVHFPASPRHIAPEQAANLTLDLPKHVRPVSVMVDPTHEELVHLHSVFRPAFVQLHGKETPARVAQIRANFPDLRLIKAISVRSAEDIRSASAYEHLVDMLMFDAKPPEPISPPLAGGTKGGNASTNHPGYFGTLPDTTRNKDTTQKAKSMRKEMTRAEWALWEQLSGKKLEGYKFRRQQTIGLYIVDFVCMEKHLIIEIDGGQHADSESDILRTAFLEKAGYRVLRFWNNEVLEQLDGVAERILQCLREDALPLPRSQAGGFIPTSPPPPAGEAGWGNGSTTSVSANGNMPSPLSPPASGRGHKEWLPGGNAVSFDWNLLKGYHNEKPWFLSGGLDERNVGAAIRITGAKLVDVSSGVESAPGVKDTAKILSFIKAAHGA